MHTRSRNTFASIHTEGSLLPPDLLQRVLAGDKELGGLTPSDYHLAQGEKLNEAINRSWNRLQGAWAAFQASRNRLGRNDPGTTLTRERWLLPLFQELNFGRLAITKAIEIEKKAYPISHGWEKVPIHLVGCRVDLDSRTTGVAGASRSSPHSLIQELLNVSEESQWGIVSNGLRLRILRDNLSLTRQAFLEFDLEELFEGDIYSDFVLLWLFCHQSRFENGDGKTEGCWLEKWSKKVQESGIRALDQLRKGVEEAITALGSGFLTHPSNQDLRKDLQSGELNTQDYYRQLLRLVYRLIFLFAAEDRDLLLDPQAETIARDRYVRYYSTAHLRHLAEQQRGGRHADLWQGLKLITDILAGKVVGSGASAGLGLPILNGFLFSEIALPDLEANQVDNQSLLNAIRSLAFTVEGSSRRAVDYKNLGPEELGSVYESLLELHPILSSEAGTFELTSASGHERKTTGSYYTPTSLIQVLLDSALDPVIEQAVKNAGASTNDQQSALLNLKVCDPACGSGHFLIAAVHRIARRLAQIQAGGDEPPPTALRSALRSVIAHCIYGVDVNPMAVELCKVNLWLESIEPGKPLSFLDAHIQCGDSLVGVSPGLDISEIPDEAFNPAFGDDKATAAVLKKRNKRERTGQLGFRWKVTELTSAEDLRSWRAERLGQVDAMPEDDPVQVNAKAKAFIEFRQTQEYINNRLEYDMWTAAFFWRIPKGNGEHMLAPTQQELVMLRTGDSPDITLLEKVRQIAERMNFFHWELAFPQVFTGENPGFNCVLGNPPWEMLQLDPREFFSITSPEIARISNNSQREKLIAKLNDDNPSLYMEYQEAKHAIDAYQIFIHNSGKFPLTSFGRINLMALFAELDHILINSHGRTALILPIGIATDSFNQYFFADLAEKQRLARMIGFENEAFIFPAVHHAFKFCVLVMTGEKDKINHTDFIFFCRYFEDIRQSARHFELTREDFWLLNPNTRTCPVFRTRTDAELTKKLYRRFPILVNVSLDDNPWEFQGMLMFMMNTDSKLFQDTLTEESVPLYEAKLMHQFDHRYGTYEGAAQSNLNAGILPQISNGQKKKPTTVVLPRYWVPITDVKSRIRGKWNRNWLIGFRHITSNVVERTFILSVLPFVATSDSIFLILLNNKLEAMRISCFIGNLNSIVFDYVTRQKIGGMNLNLFIVNQLPVLPPSAYTPIDIEFIAPRVLELVYTAYDLKPFAEDMGYHGEPFRWDEEHRALLRAELDAYYARLYGLTRDELRYILDPQDVYGPDFPGETFRVLKEKEIKQYGEYRTRRMVLEAWDRLEGVEPAQPPPVAQLLPKDTLIEKMPNDQILAKPARPVNNPKPAREKPAQDELQPGLIDFSVYRCMKCDKMVMGYDRENHLREVHGGKSVEWKKVR